jgi:hypothetical protein
MGDIYKEQLVKKDGSADFPVRAGIMAAAFLICLAAAGASLIVAPLFQFMPLIVIAVLAGAVYLVRMRNIEYEYIFTNGELDIDCIYNKTKRKRVFSAEVKAFESFEAVAPGALQGRGEIEKKDFTGGKEKDNVYAFVCTYQGKRLKGLIEPNEKMLQAMLPYLGRKYIKTGRV